VKYLVLLLFVFPNFCFGQHISKSEQQADSLFKLKKYDEAIGLFNQSISNKQINYIDSLRITFKKAEIFYIVNDINKSNDCNVLLTELIHKYPQINQNAHWKSYLLYIKGKSQRLVQEHDLASELIKKAISIRLQADIKDELTADMINSLGDIHMYLNNYEKSILLFKLAIKYYKTNKLYNKIVKVLLNESYIYWLKNDLINYKQLLDVAVKIINLFPVDENYIVLTYMNLGTYYLQQSDYFSAYKYFKLLENFENDGVSKEQIKFYLAMSSFYLGDYFVANKYFEKISANNLNSRLLFEYHYYYAYLSVSKKDFGLSLYFLKKCYNSNIRNNRIKPEEIEYSIANTFYKQNQLDSALKYVNLSIKDCNASDISRYVYARCLLLKGKIHNNSESENLYDKAQQLTITETDIKHSRTGYIFAETGIARFENKNYRKALADFQQALISVDLDFNSTNVIKNPECKNVLSFVNLAKALQYKSECLSEIYFQTDSLPYLIASFETAKLLSTQIEKMLKSYPLFESKQFLLDNSQHSFVRAQYLAYLCWKKTANAKYKNENLIIAEQSRAAILTAQMQENKFSKNNVSDSSSVELNEIEQGIAYLTGQINEYSPSNKSELSQKLNKQLFELQEMKNKLLESYKGEYGNFSSYFKQSQDMSFDELINFPLSEQIVLEYSLCDSVILLNVIQKGYLNVFEIKYDSLLKQCLTDYKNYLVPSEEMLYKIATLAKVNELGKYLYNRLILPAQSLISGKQLIFVQEPKLGFIPFEAFVSKQKYLIELHAVSYIYSINVTHESNRCKNSKNKSNMLAFFPEYNSEKLDNSYPAKKYYDGLSALQHEKETRNLLQIVDCDTFMLQHATEDAFKKNASNYSIVHLSLHSILDSENYLTSKLCFTPTKDSLNDGVFNICDVVPLRLNADLVVLSGCNTGNGEIITGEGIMSFARSFILAGSRAILMSLWELDNSSAIAINTGFYKYLTEGYNKAEALRLSKLDFLNNADRLHQHPFFWSGFVLIGDSENIKVPQPTNYVKIMFYVLGIFAFIIIVSLFLKLKYDFCWRRKLKDKILGL